jgi:hypothetical protein
VSAKEAALSARLQLVRRTAAASEPDDDSCTVHACSTTMLS